MNLSDYIKQLQKLEKVYGDLPVIYASDDEGNNYHKVGGEAGCPCQVEDIDDYYLARVYFEDDEDDDVGYNAVIIN